LVDYGLTYNEKDSNVLVKVMIFLVIFMNGIGFALITIGMPESVTRSTHTLAEQLEVSQVKKYDFSKLMKMSWNYEDQFTDNWLEGMTLCDIASDMKSIGMSGLAFTFQTLAQFKLEKCKVIMRLCK